jgi:hypothetical protein
MAARLTQIEVGEWYETLKGYRLYIIGKSFNGIGFVAERFLSDSSSTGFVIVLDGVVHSDPGDYVVRHMVAKQQQASETAFPDDQKLEAVLRDAGGHRTFTTVVTADFEKDLRVLINKHIVENGSDTPDFIMSDFLSVVIAAFNNSVRARDKWYNRPKQQDVCCGANRKEPRS